MWESLVDFGSSVIAPANLPYTVFLVLVVLYWLIVLLGVLDFDTLDVDLDIDADMDMDLDMDMDVDVEVSTHGLSQSATAGEPGAVGGTVADAGIMIATLRFFGLGEVPLMILLSVQIVLMWLGSMILNDTLRTAPHVIFALIWLVPLFLGCAFVTKIITLPVRYLYGMMNQGIREQKRVVGRVCVVTSSRATHDFGQAELVVDGSPWQLHVRTAEGEELPQGQEAVVLSCLDKEKRVFLVKKLEL